MQDKQNTNRHLITIGSALAMLAALAVVPAGAAPLDIADRPLFSAINARPNLQFLIDDSGSMDWEVVSLDSTNGGRFTGTQPDGSNPAGAGSVKHRDSDNDGDADCGFGNGDDVGGTNFFGYFYIVEFGSNTYRDGGADCNTADDEAWRIRNSNFNPLYYNPQQLYTPWAGLDEDGDSFTDIDPTNAPDDPYDPNEVIDLTRHNSDWSGGNNPRNTSDRDGDREPDGFRYYGWDDDGDGIYENGEQREVQIKDLPFSPLSYGDSNGDGAVGPGDTMTINTAGRNGVTITYPDSQTNFANWFSYYRSRDLLAKNAYGKVIAENTTTRMGLVTLHNNNSVNTPIEDMNAEPTGGHKRRLLNALYRFGPSGGTPLRFRMYECGVYMGCFGNPFNFDDSCPALPLSQGGNCQQNFLITMTDGFYNGGLSNLGNRDADGAGEWDGGAYADEHSNTLADIAMLFYEIDIHADLPNDLIPSVSDPAPHQHIVNYSVAFGVDGTIDAMPADEQASFAWPDPQSSDAAKIDDLRHAAYNGRGLFLDASDPSRLEKALNAAITDIENKRGSASALSINTGSISSGSRLYQASFIGGDWIGELRSLAISDGATSNPNCPADALSGDVCDDDPVWTAADALTQRTPESRLILTSNAAGTGIAFKYDELSGNSGSGQQSQITPAQLAYIRGDRSNEVSTANNNNAPFFRDRLSLLGDIVNSSPVFVGAPDRLRYPVDWDDRRTTGNDSTLEDSAALPYRSATGTDDFLSTYANRTPMVYVGANDGMLHGFDATEDNENGEERLAYVPSDLIPALNELTDPVYGHRYYVDGNPVVVDAVIDSSGSPAWRSVLVSNLRAGGRSIFALDVTDPSTFSEANADQVALWEFTHNDLGLTFSEPAIVRLHNGRWHAIFGNGYNSPTGSASLFIVDLSTGNLVSQIDTLATPGNGNPAYSNGLSSVSPVDLDGDFITDYVYAGDLYGNLWQFDLTAASPASWGVGFGTAAAPEPLFTACEAASCTADNRQPITVEPQVGRHPFGLDHGVMVYFGTGKYIENGDREADTSSRHAFYGIWDLDVFSFQDNPPFSTTVKNGFNRSRLTGQSIIEDVNDSGQTFRIVSQNAVQYQQDADDASATTGGANKRGWVLDLPASSGELVVTDANLRGQVVIFSTLIPSGLPCDPDGSGFFMTVDAATGGRTDFSALDVNGDRQFTTDDVVTDSSGNDAAPSGLKFEDGAPGRAGLVISRQTNSDVAEVPLTNATIERVDVNVGLQPEGRRSWRELRR